jgi:hypothetical protein
VPRLLNQVFFCCFSSGTIIALVALLKTFKEYGMKTTQANIKSIHSEMLVNLPE